MISKQAAAELRHTLRTPLNHISGYSEILLEDLEAFPGYAEASRLLRAIRQDALRNLEAIQNILSRQADTANIAFALRQQMERPLSRIESAAEALQTILPQTMLADLGRIRNATRELAGEIETPGRGKAAASGQGALASQSPLDLDTGAASLLVVDDDEANRDMLSRRLSRSGYSVSLADGGETALERLRQGGFDLVLLDLIMPGLNGMQVIEIIRSDAELCDIPVILISALDDMDTVARCIELGAEDYLFKPVNPTLLRARVRSTLDRKRAEMAIRRKQELESIGALAAGVAHDFNNLLTGVLGNACMLRDNLPPGDENRYFTDEIIKSSERAADLTRQLLAYSGKVRYTLESLDLAALVSGIAGILRNLLPPHVDLCWNMERVPPVAGDSEQLRQMVVNLVSNAGEAVDGESGAVTLATGVEILNQITFDESLLGDPRPGRYAYLEVRDTGQGMEPGAIGKIFDPFYTTKFFGRGLGLAAVAGIVRMHGAALRVSTAPGAGSCFRVLFPLEPES